MARLVDVARVAGVSRATVSNVYNNPEKVRPEVRARVHDAARALGFAGPDPKARILMGGKVHAIGVMTLGVRLTHPFSSVYGREFMTGVAEVCDETPAGLALISGRDEGRVWAARNAIVDGFIVQHIGDLAVVEAAGRQRLPIVVVDGDTGPDTSSVRIDDRGGARAQVRHLLDLGHRRFVLSTPLRQDDHPPVFHAPGSDHRPAYGSIVDHDRVAGWAEVLAEAGISISDVPYVEIPWGKHLDEGVSWMLDKAPEATAAITGADDGALPLMREARRRGILIPRDLSVVGYDNAPEAAHADPPLTTVAQDAVAKGVAAARLLLEGGPPRHVVLPVKLIVRGSTAPPRA
jgi:DNA-binding LacI/PurR family transcriptional regulator